MAGREVFFEFKRVGAYVRVSAIDSVTGTEVTVAGDAKAGEAMLKQTALRKLQYVLSKGSAPGNR
ncbi:MAG: hypothetical protein AB7G62_07415 [Magnetospirillum sp.]